MMERWQIEGRGPQEIAFDLVEAFDQFCPAVMKNLFPAFPDDAKLWVYALPRPLSDAERVGW